MDTDAFYNTIEKDGVAEHKEKGSRFIAYANRVIHPKECKTRLHALKKVHPKATHHCFAYRLGLDKNNFRVSDAGEPSGTAGKPVLGQIDSRKLTNTQVVVVRYFGGSLLGTSGLINAYKSAAALVLQLTPIIQKPVEALYRLQFDYTQTNEVMMLLRQYGCTVLEQDMQLFCMVKMGIPVNKREEVVCRLQNLRNVQVDEA